MPRVKRGTKRRANRKKTLALAQGFFLTKSKLYRAAQEAVERSLAAWLYRPQTQEARFPLAVDRPHQCRVPGGRNFVQQVHGWLEEGRYRSEP